MSATEGPAEGYGAHQEHVATALRDLLTQRVRHPRFTRDQREELQLLRDQVRAGLEARLYVVGRGDHVSPALAAGPKLDPGLIRTRGLHLLHTVLADHPAPATGHSAGDVLPAPRDHRVLEAWRTAGRHLLLGNHALQDTTSQWHADNPATATLVADLTEAVEAFAVLDDDLAASQLLDHTRQTTPVWNQRGTRAICSTIAREARWIAADTSEVDVDGTVAVARAHQLVDHVHITGWASLAEAQRHLGRLIHPANPDLTKDPTQRLSVARSRGVLLLQAQSSALIGRHAATTKSAEEVRVSSIGRARTLVDAMNQARRWVDLDATTAVPALRRQTHELSRAITASDQWPSPTLGELVRVDDAIATTSSTLATALRGDLIAHHARYAERLTPTNARLAPADVTQTRLYTACSAIIATPRVNLAGPQWTQTTARTQLRVDLAATATRLDRQPFTRLDYSNHARFGTARTDRGK